MKFEPVVKQIGPTKWTAGVRYITEDVDLGVLFDKSIDVPAETVVAIESTPGEAVVYDSWIRARDAAVARCSISEERYRYTTAKWEVVE